MHTQAYLFRLLRRGTTIIVTTCSSVIGSPFCGKMLEEVGLIGMRHVVGGGHSGINVDVRGVFGLAGEITFSEK